MNQKDIVAAMKSAISEASKGKCDVDDRGYLIVHNTRTVRICQPAVISQWSRKGKKELESLHK